MNSKKAQAVLLIVVALVLVFVFVLVFRLLSGLYQDNPVSEQEGEVALLENYISSCLDKKLHKAIILLGRQGGRIYDSQGGATSFPPSKDYVESDKGNYVIVMDISTPSLEEFFNKNHFAPYVCNDILPVSPSQDPFKENSLKLKTGCKLGEVYDDIRNFIYYSEGKMVKYDFEYDLFHYLNNTLDECYDFAEDEFEFEVNPSKDWDLDVHVTDEEIITDLERQITLEYEDGRKDKITNVFRNTARVRMKKLVKFIHQIVSEEERNLSFNPAHYSRDGFKVVIDRDISNTYNDVLRFVDEQSYVYGDKFEIWVGRENYYPIISFLPTEIVENSGVYNSIDEPVYINKSEIGNTGEYQFEKDLPNVEPHFIHYWVNCSKAARCFYNINDNNPQTICDMSTFEDHSLGSNASIIRYLMENELVAFFDRDEDDSLNSDWKIDWETNLSCKPGSFAVRNSQFYVKFNVTDGEYTEESKVIFEYKK